MTQIHADKKFGILPLYICVHRPRYLRAKVFSYCSSLEFVLFAAPKILYTLLHADQLE